MTGQTFLTMKRLIQERSQLRLSMTSLGYLPPLIFGQSPALLTIIGRQRDVPRLIQAVPEGATSWFGLASHIRDMLKYQDPHRRLADIEPIPSSKFPQAATRPKNSIMANNLLQSSLGKPLGKWEDWHNSLHGR